MHWSQAPDDPLSTVSALGSSRHLAPCVARARCCHMLVRLVRRATLSLVRLDVHRGVGHVFPALRNHWSAIPLGLAAVVLLVLSAVLSTPTSTALVGAGSALAGVAAARIIDLEREHRAQAAQSEASRQRDLDETRRIAYMALACGETERYELVATIVNALAHHGSAADPDQAMRHLITIVTSGPDRDNSLAWLRGEISRLTIELDA